MTTLDTETPVGVDPHTPLRPLSERLRPVLRKTLLTKKVATLNMQVDAIIAAVTAELCPPGHLLVQAEVIQDHDEGMDTPDGYEPPYDYAVIADFRLAHAELTGDTGPLLALESENGELAPDGTTTLSRDISEFFGDELETFLTRKNPTDKPALALVAQEDRTTP